MSTTLPAEDRTQPLWLRSRTSIDRATGTVRHRALFITEVVAGSGWSLCGWLRARHPPGVLTQDDGGFPFEYALLLAGLLSIDRLGSEKSAGLGKCQIAIPDGKVRWNDDPQYPLAQALTSLEDPEWLEMLKLLRSEGNQ